MAAADSEDAVLRSRLQNIAQNGKTAEDRAWAQATLDVKFKQDAAKAAQEDVPGSGEAAVRSFSEGVTPGSHRFLQPLGTAIGDWAAEKFSGAPSDGQTFGEVFDEAQKESRGRLRHATAANPWTSFGSSVLGAGVGAPGLLAKGVLRGLEKVPWLGTPGTGTLASTLKGVGRGAVTYEATAPAVAAVSDPNEQGSLEAAKRTALDPKGLAMSILFGAASGRAQRHLARAGDPKTAAGRTLADVKAAGGKVKAFGDEPVAGGEYDTPAMRKLPEGREGVNRAGAQAGKSFTKFNRLVLRSARTEYGEELGQLARDNPEPLNLTPVSRRLDGLIKRQSNGEIANPEVAAAVDDIKRLITPGGGRPGPQILDASGRPFPQRTPAARATLQDLRQAKETVADRAQFSEPVTKDNAPYRVIYRALADASHDIDPRLAAIDQKFGATMTKLERANDIMFGRDTADIASRAASERTAAASFGRAGDSSQAGTIRVDQLDELAALDPLYARLLTRVRGKKAQEELRYGNEGANQKSFEESAQQRGTGVMDMILGTPRDRAIRSVRVGVPVAEVIQKAAPAAMGAAAQMGSPLGPGLLGASNTAASEKKKRKTKKENE